MLLKIPMKLPRIVFFGLILGKLYRWRIIAGAIYYFQAKISLQQMPAEQQKQMKMMTMLSPMMILFISFSAPAALPLYWSVGGLFLINKHCC